MKLLMPTIYSIVDVAVNVQHLRGFNPEYSPLDQVDFAEAKNWSICRTQPEYDNHSVLDVAHYFGAFINHRPSIHVRAEEEGPQEEENSPAGHADRERAPVGDVSNKMFHD